MPDNNPTKNHHGFRQWLYRCQYPLCCGLTALLLSIYSESSITHIGILVALIAAWLLSLSDSSSSAFGGNDSHPDKSELLLSLSDEISEQVKNETAKLQEDLNRINSLLADSITVLQENFVKITQKTEVQSKNIRYLINSLCDVNNNEEEKLLLTHFAESTSTVVQFFFNMLAEIKDESLATIDRINDMENNFESISATLDQVNRLSEQTHLLANNTAIQSAQAGASDLGFGIVADQVRALSLSSNKLNTDMGDQIQQFKNQMTSLSVAANKAVSLDMTTAIAHKQSIQNIVLQISDQNASTQITLDSIDNTANFIDGELNNSIRALQYEDIVSQLSSHIHERLHHVNELSSMLGQVVRAEEQGEQEIEMLQKKLALNRANNQQRLEHAIAQESMDEGDVELF